MDYFHAQHAPSCFYSLCIRAFENCLIIIIIISNQSINQNELYRLLKRIFKKCSQSPEMMLPFCPNMRLDTSLAHQSAWGNSKYGHNWKVESLEQLLDIIGRCSVLLFSSGKVTVETVGCRLFGRKFIHYLLYLGRKMC